MAKRDQMRLGNFKCLNTEEKKVKKHMNSVLRPILTCYSEAPKTKGKLSQQDVGKPSLNVQLAS